MSVFRSFNPLTKCVTSITPEDMPHSFQHWCKKSVVKSIGLRNLHLIDSLPIPGSLRQNVAALSLSDFLIDVDKMPPECHSTDVYPANCLLTGQQVNLRLLPQGTEANEVDMRHLTWFKEQNHVFVVEVPTKTLCDVIRDCNEENKLVDEKFIWLLLAELVQYLLEQDPQPSIKLDSSCVIFLPDNRVFVEIKENPHPFDAMTYGFGAAVYEAPEVLSNSNADARALVWSIGCILYEAVALEPAFYDPYGSNMFQVYMKVKNGVIPPLPFDSCSVELRTLIRKCLTHNVDERLTLEQLGENSKHFQQTLCQS